MTSFGNVAVSVLTPVEVVASQCSEGVSTFPGYTFWPTVLPLSFKASAVMFASSSVYSSIILNQGDLVATFSASQVARSVHQNAGYPNKLGVHYICSIGRAGSVACQLVQ